MTDQLSFVRVDPEDTDRILPLLRETFGPDDMAAGERFWRWKHVANPFGKSACLVAEASGKVVGLRAFMRWQWKVGDLNLSAVRAVDTATHPDWQGRRIFTRLTTSLLEELKQEGVAFVFNTPNQASRPGYLKMGWRPVGRIPLMIKPRHPVRLLVPGPADGRVTPEMADARTWDAAVGGASSSHVDVRLHTPRSSNYLRWRYRECPIVDYGSVAAGRAVVIFRCRTRSGRREVSLSEVLVGDGSGDIKDAARLVREIAGRTAADYLIACAAPGTPQRRVLGKAGFLPPIPVGPIFTVRTLSGSEAPDLLRWSSWSCSVGDVELF